MISIELARGQVRGIWGGGAPPRFLILFCVSFSQKLINCLYSWDSLSLTRESRDRKCQVSRKSGLGPKMIHFLQEM